ncbi:MAG: hypothetical protein H0T46_27775 [Deltaproteobacteria bacterium]|nr:hypothetical protein [Deltaproteobacteria bacterium]
MKLGWLVVVLAFAACKSNDECEARAAKAEQIAAEARKEAEEARQVNEKLSKDLAELDVKLEAAVATVGNAQNDADRAAARAKLEELRKEARPIPINPTKSSGRKREDCLNNPLAKGC